MDDNTSLLFGYGKIILCADICGGITAYITDTNRKCGTGVDNMDISNCKSIVIPMREDLDYKQLMLYISSVEVGFIDHFKFKDIEFDFTKRDIDSIKSVKDVTDKAWSHYIRLSAC